MDPFAPFDSGIVAVDHAGKRFSKMDRIGVQPGFDILGAAPPN